jgi:hypothetical protein
VVLGIGAASGVNGARRQIFSGSRLNGKISVGGMGAVELFSMTRSEKTLPTCRAVGSR